MFKSKVLEKVRAGQCVLCTNASAGPAPMLVGLAAQTGFDAVWIDCEHRGFTEEQTAAMILACRCGGADPLVRIRKESATSFFRPLEMAAAGIMVPHVMSPDEARWAVRNTRFALGGLRGMDGAGPDADYTLASQGDYLPFANRETFVALQVEDREAVEQIDEIAAVDGYEIIFIGPADLTQSLGIPLQLDHPKLHEAVARIAKACTEHGKVWGMPAGSVNHAQRLIEQGARFVNLGADIPILAQAWRQMHDEFRDMQARAGV